MRTAPTVRGAGAYMAHHSRSFRLATLVLPRRDRGRIERVYAWCRHVDNIVDVGARGDAQSGRGGWTATAGRERHTVIDVAERTLDDWLARSRDAYDGMPVGDQLLDRVMGDMRACGAPFGLAEALIEGVRSDLRFSPFTSMRELREYTFSVASVVGLWLAALHGVRDRWMTHRAAALGHAMQLTNILRDVGEDLDDGRIYVPTDMLERHGLSAADLVLMRVGLQPIGAAYRALMEELMAQADTDYALAAEAIPFLPQPFGRSVAVAAAVYSDIHSAIRQNGYDNFTRRARTTLPRKLVLAAGAIRTSSIPAASRRVRRLATASACT